MVVEGARGEGVGAVGPEVGGGDEVVGEGSKGVDGRWAVTGWDSGVWVRALRLSMRREDIISKHLIRCKSQAMTILLRCVPRSPIREAPEMT